MKETYSIQSNHKEKAVAETLAQGSFTVCAFVSTLAVAAICFYMIKNGVPAITKVGFKEILFSTTWTPTSVEPKYGILWIILTGVPMAIEHAVTGLALCCTIIGIPFGLQHFKHAKLALMPFGARIYRI